MFDVDNIRIRHICVACLETHYPTELGLDLSGCVRHHWRTFKEVLYVPHVEAFVQALFAACIPKLKQKAKNRSGPAGVHYVVVYSR